MTLAYYVDHYVPSAITRGLRDRGIEVLTAAEDGAEEWEDEAILERATSLLKTVFTQDRDFHVLAQQWQSTGREFAGVVYGHQLEVTIGKAIHDLELLAAVFDPSDILNRVEFLPLS